MGETTIINLSRLIAPERRLYNVANNVANANTTGFRARQLSFQEYLSPAKENDAVVMTMSAPSSSASPLANEAWRQSDSAYLARSWVRSSRCQA